VRRREVIAGLGAAAAWPLAARAQQGVRMRRIGVLMATDENDPEAMRWLSGFTQGLAASGWNNGRNLRMDVRWAAANVDRMRMFAKELVDLQPDVIFANTTPVTAALQRVTLTIPIVFAVSSDPMDAGFVARLPRPGGNITGFIKIEAGMGGKWLELLTEITPGIKRVAIMFNPDTAPGGGSYYLPSFEAAARLLKVEPIAAPVHSDAEIETVVTSLARAPGSGLVVMPDGFMQVHRAPIILLVAQSNVPAVYSVTDFVRDGGLLSYGPDRADVFRRSASYIDRILRGAKPWDLPVQLPVKFEMAINPQDRQVARPDGAAIDSAERRRGDRMIKRREFIAGLGSA
jgi:putative tryptophan/tyrosine transport system substrate-binding protein